MIAFSLFHCGVIITERSQRTTATKQAGSRKWNPRPADRSQSLPTLPRSKHGMKRKDSDIKVTTPCHLGARHRLQHIALVHVHVGLQSLTTPLLCASNLIFLHVCNNLHLYICTHTHSHSWGQINKT